MVLRAGITLFIMSAVCDAIISVYPFDAPYLDVKPAFVTVKAPQSHGGDDLCNWLRHKRPYSWQLGLIDRCQVHKQDRETVTLKVELFVNKLPHIIQKSPTDIQSWFINWLFGDKKEPCLTIVDIPGRKLFDNLQRKLLLKLSVNTCDNACNNILQIYTISALVAQLLHHEYPKAFAFARIREWFYWLITEHGLFTNLAIVSECARANAFLLAGILTHDACDIGRNVNYYVFRVR
ncbi:hypothetical protein CLF_112139 [Clonorchis sinensis]|uniref:Uncharacterized protein n=1 Tax=Clonorchis sinensis TaxID=79923 RepID=G7YMA4_CLOSI|nr:hypothetical protein CLF_112139 [Clonorchis sinensis]